jgi:phosphopantetheine adenylyltransferase / dephospho-CoA kinase
VFYYIGISTFKLSMTFFSNQAIKRLMKRNNLSEEEAEQRVDAHPSNLEQVAVANIVFSPFWSYEYTQGQVDRAWDNLQEYLNNRKTV